MMAITKDSIVVHRPSLIQTDYPPEFNYHLLRYALSLYKKNISQLTDDEFNFILNKAKKSFELETLVINSAAAEAISLSSVQIEDAFLAVARRYEQPEELSQELQSNSLDERSLRKALYNELLFNEVMQAVSEEIPVISDIDIKLFYEMHSDRFNQPEKRRVYHILITVNPDFQENTPYQAKQNMLNIADKLNNRVNRFEDFAQRYSECPTAMEGGKLGDVVRGQLYPELDEAVFNLHENEISQIIETEMGFHLIWCETIIPAKKVPLSRVRDKIRGILEQRQQHGYQSRWLEGLKEEAMGD